MFAVPRNNLGHRGVQSTRGLIGQSRQERLFHRFNWRWMSA